MPGMDLSDHELAARAGQGDAEAYRRLFEQYQGPVYNFVYRLVDNAEDASDIVQDAFIRMYGVLGQKDIENFSAYLYRTAKNLAYDEMRRRTRFADVDSEMLVPEDPSIYADPQRALLLGEQMETVRRAARGLNENQRAALILRELEELDYDRMSDILESNRNAVGALLSRARLKFREELRMAQISTEQCPPECEEVIAMLSPYIDGELKVDQVESVESHLEGCTFCLAALEEMREASRSFRMFIPVLPPADMAQAFTGRLQEASGQSGAGQGAGEGSGHGSGEGANQGFAGRGRLSRLFRTKAMFIGIAGFVMLVPAVALMAETTGESGQPEALSLTSAASIQTQTTAAKMPGATAPGVTTLPATTPATTSGAAPASGDAAGAAATSVNGAGGGSAGNGGNSASGSGGSQPAPTPPPPAPPPPAPVTILSGAASPNPVYTGYPVSYTAVIDGSASSVSMTLVSLNDGSTITIPLSLKSSGRGGETWSGTGYAPRAARYSLTVTATGSAGQTDTMSAGTLVVNPIIY